MYDIAIQALMVLVVWFFLMFISTNLVGFLVRSIFTNDEMADSILNSEVISKDHRKARIRTIIIVSVLIVISFAAVYHFSNIGLVIALLMLMAARVPDLIWEIKNRRPLQLEDMVKPKFSYLTTLVSWASLPVVWYALYRM